MADNYRKPVPKSQREISTNLQTPYDAQLGNPNDASEGSQYPPNNHPNMNQKHNLLPLLFYLIVLHNTFGQYKYKLN